MAEQYRDLSNKGILQEIKLNLGHLRELHNMTNVLQNQLTEMKSIIRNSADITTVETSVAEIKTSNDLINTKLATQQISLDDINTKLVAQKTTLDAQEITLDAIEATQGKVNVYQDETLSSGTSADHWEFTTDKNIEILHISVQTSGSTGNKFLLGATIGLSNKYICACAATAYPGFSVYSAYSGTQLVAQPVALGTSDFLELTCDINRTIVAVLVVYRCAGSAATLVLTAA